VREARHRFCPAGGFDLADDRTIGDDHRRSPLRAEFIGFVLSEEEDALRS
jgi:hypothetical protein